MTSIFGKENVSNFLLVFRRKLQIGFVGGGLLNRVSSLDGTGDMLVPILSVKYATNFNHLTLSSWGLAQVASVSN